jgi:hypothetical protein
MIMEEKKFIVLYRSWYSNLNTQPSRACIEAADWKEAHGDVLRFNGGTVDVVSIFDVSAQREVKFMTSGGGNDESSNKN